MARGRHLCAIAVLLLGTLGGGLGPAKQLALLVRLGRLKLFALRSWGFRAHSRLWVQGLEGIDSKS